MPTSLINEVLDAGIYIVDNEGYIETVENVRERLLIELNIREQGLR